MNARVLYLYFSLLFGATQLSGQNIFLQVRPSSGSKEVAKLNYKKKFTSKDAAYRELDNVLLTLRFKGYLLAAADSIYEDASTLYAVVSEGAMYRFAILKTGNLNPNLASKLGMSEKLYAGKAFRYREVARSIEKIIRYYENNGYPFVAVQLDSVEIEGEQIRAGLNVEKNRLFRIDSIKIEGDAKVNRRFLDRYLSIRQGMPYNEEALAAIPQKLKQLPFVVQKRPQEVKPTEKTTRLYLFLDKKNASQFDGIVGLLPDATTKKTVITGDVKLKVVNGIFHNVETFDLQWRRLQSQTQDFKGRMIYPFLFGSPVGTDYSLKLYRRDTTFIDIQNNIGLQYYFSGLNHLKIFYKNRTLNLISTRGLEAVTVLPEFADITTDSYGAGMTLEKLDYRFNPHKGASVNFSAQTGNRTIRKNAKINDLAYQNVDLRSTQYQFEGEMNFYFQLYRNNVLKLGFQGASVAGTSTIFRNELFRIGGLRTLRGFDEESIFASSYVIPTLEYRFLFAENSNILVFAEGAWYENTSNGRYFQDTPTSIGAGVNFETKAGILTMNYAVGNQLGNGFDFRSGKIHVGLTALF